MKRFAVLALVIALAAVACSSGGGSEGLTLYSGRSEDLVQPLIDRFTDETGIEVTVKYAGSADLAATLSEEGTGSPADVFFAQDPASLGTVALAGLLSPLPTDVLSKIPERFSDSQGRWVGTSGRARVVVYDATTIDPRDLPATEDGFTDPQWRGRVGIAPTNGSFLSFVSAKILVDGEDATLRWLEGMASNASQTFPKNSAIVAAVNDGQIEAGLVNHYYLLRALAESPDLPGANFFFEVATPGSLVMPAGVGILASSDKQESAKKFVEFLLSDESQSYFATETFEYPLVPGIPASELLPPLETIPTPDIDLSMLATVLDTATDLVARAG
ncbi:MAG: iron ABC transporter substrate-binding protein, partial [Actinomycetia bacterium]|nr:iron ABC transporter substrate-binding protein [Actinomycetes bacterium]